MISKLSCFSCNRLLKTELDRRYAAYKESPWTAITAKESNRLIHEKLKAAAIKEKRPSIDAPPSRDTDPPALKPYDP